MNSSPSERRDDVQRSFTDAHSSPTKTSYQFTPDEMRVLKDCNRESFYYRCLPLSTILGGGVYYGVKMGAITAHAKYGATPKVVLATIVGYFFGKFSYQSRCAEKLMQLPNSPMGEMLRKRRKGGFQESLDPGFGPGMSLAPFSGMNSSDTYSDVTVPQNSVDLDTTRPDIDGLDDTYRPSVDSNPTYEEEMPPLQKYSTTYEELRKKNRQEYQDKRTGVYRPVAQPPQTENPAVNLQSNPSRSPGMPKERTNKYGDKWE